eukprot:XP_001698280.1 predicted protein [Chlamydomonas reinhardtii]
MRVGTAPPAPGRNAVTATPSGVQPDTSSFTVPPAMPPRPQQPQLYPFTASTQLVQAAAVAASAAQKPVAGQPPARGSLPGTSSAPSTTQHGPDRAKPVDGQPLPPLVRGNSGPPPTVGSPPPNPVLPNMVMYPMMMPAGMPPGAYMTFNSPTCSVATSAPGTAASAAGVALDTQQNANHATPGEAATAQQQQPSIYTIPQLWPLQLPAAAGGDAWAAGAAPDYNAGMLLHAQPPPVHQPTPMPPPGQSMQFQGPNGTVGGTAMGPSMAMAAMPPQGGVPMPVLMSAWAGFRGTATSADLARSHSILGGLPPAPVIGSSVTQGGDGSGSPMAYAVSPAGFEGAYYFTAAGPHYQTPVGGVAYYMPYVSLTASHNPMGASCYAPAPVSGDMEGVHGSVADTPGLGSVTADNSLMLGGGGGAGAGGTSVAMHGRGSNAAMGPPTGSMGPDMSLSYQSAGAGPLAAAMALQPLAYAQLPDSNTAPAAMSASSGQGWPHGSGQGMPVAAPQLAVMSASSLATGGGQSSALPPVGTSSSLRRLSAVAYEGAGAAASHGSYGPQPGSPGGAAGFRDRDREGGCLPQGLQRDAILEGDEEEDR